MRPLAALLVSCALLITPSAQSQKSTINPEIPTVINLGMEAYRQSGAGEAIKAWLKDSPLQSTRDTLKEVNNLHSVESYYGAFQYFDVISVKDLSPRVKVVFVAMNYDKGPLFARFVAYRAQGEWILTSFDFNTDERQILEVFPQ
jgi:hypothetical protein